MQLKVHGCVVGFVSLFPRQMFDLMYIKVLTIYMLEPIGVLTVENSVMRLRNAESSDSFDIFTWRNDPSTRAASLNSAEVSWDEHLRWFNSALNDPLIRFYIACDPERHAESIAMCRFNFEQDESSAEISINLNPAFRGLRLSQVILREALKRLVSESSSVRRVSASIREENHPSMRIFLSENFIPTRSQAGVTSLELELRLE